MAAQGQGNRDAEPRGRVTPSISSLHCPADAANEWHIDRMMLWVPQHPRPWKGPLLPFDQRGFRVPQTWEQNSALPLWIGRLQISCFIWASVFASVTVRTPVHTLGSYCERWERKHIQGRPGVAVYPTFKSCPVNVSLILLFLWITFSFHFGFFSLVNTSRSQP